MDADSPWKPVADELRATALALADAARLATLHWFRSAELAADNKDAAGFDPVTEADRAAERAMREVLAERRPDDAILGEEFGSRRGTTGLTWILDPVDGTRAFLAGAPTWGVLIALADDSGPLLGVIGQAFIGGDEFFRLSPHGLDRRTSGFAQARRFRKQQPFGQRQS